MLIVQTHRREAVLRNVAGERDQVNVCEREGNCNFPRESIHHPVVGFYSNMGGRDFRILSPTHSRFALRTPRAASFSSLVGAVCSSAGGSVSSVSVAMMIGKRSRRN